MGQIYISVLTAQEGPRLDTMVADLIQRCSEEVTRTFDPAKQKKEAALRLTRISQGNRSVVEYAAEYEFYTLATSCDWNELAQYDMFYAGLAERIKDELAAHTLPRTFNGLIDMTINIDTRIEERIRECTGPTRFSDRR